jgi:hypothetical protein
MKISNGMALIGLTVALGACASGRQTDARVAAASACQGMVGNEATAEFYKPGQVYGAQEIERREIVARAIHRTRTVGAELYVHAPRNVTGEYLERALTCHATMGQPAHPNDPLHPSEGSVRRVSVRSAGGAFAVQVVGDSPQAGREIWARARAFAAGSNVDVRQVARASSDGAL